MLHPIRRNVASLTAAQVVARSSSTVLIIVVARFLGPGPLGLIAFAQAITIYFTVLSDFGLTTLGVREIAKDPSATPDWVSAILWVQIVVTAILLLILGLLLWILPFEPELKFVTIIFGAGMLPSAVDLTYVFQARQRMEFVVIIRTLGQLTFLVSGVVLVVLLRQAIAVPIAAFLGASLAAALSLVLLRRYLNVEVRWVRSRDLLQTSSAAAPFVTGGLLSGLYHNAVPAIMRGFSDFRTIGLFSAGYRTVMVFLSGADILSNALLPPMASSFVRDRAVFERYALMLAQTLGGLAWAISVVGSLMAPQVFAFLFGPQYSPGLNSFRILMALPVLGMLSTALNVPLLVANQQVHCMLSVVAGVAVTVLFTVLLVPLVGLNGAAISTLLGEVGILFYLVVVFAAKLGFARQIVMSYSAKPAVASVAVVGLYLAWIYGLRLGPSLLEAAVLAILYGICALAIRLVPPELLQPQATRGARP